MNNILKKQSSITFITFIAITVLAFKSGPVFKELSFPSVIGPRLNSFDWLEFSQYVLSFLSVFALELAVLLFVYRGEKWESTAFAVFSGLCSLYYFNQFIFSLENWNANIMQVAISAIFPFVVVRFSHLYKQSDVDQTELQKEIASLKQALEEEELEKTRLNNQLDKLRQDNKLGLDKSNLEITRLEQELSTEKGISDSLELEVTELKRELEVQEQEFETLTLELNQLKLEKQKREERLSCLKCGAGPFETTQALTGHKRTCKEC